MAVISRLRFATLLSLTLSVLVSALNGQNQNGGLQLHTARTLEEKHARVADVMQRKVDFWRANHDSVTRIRSTKGKAAPIKCVDGAAVVDGEAYPCNNVDFFSVMSNEELTISRPEFPSDLEVADLADIWGWKSPSGREITLLCLTTGMRFIDSTDPLNPINLGFMKATRLESYWCDVKVHKNVAYIVKDKLSSQPVLPTDGIHVFDLTRLEAVTTESPDLEWLPDSIYDKHGNSHNVVVNTESEFLYTVGNRGDTCNRGLHMVDISDPLNPQFAGCAGADGYVHDAQCVLYTGADLDFIGREICFGYNEDTLTIFDVTDKSAPVILSKTSYPSVGYTHQGWLNSDMDVLFLDDEVDELNGQPNTRTMIFNIESLFSPLLTGIYKHPSPAIDHNLYIWGAIHAKGWGGNPPMANPPSDLYMYNANYESGLRVVDISGMKLSPPELKEVGFFDVAPDRESADFFGSWSTYMHPSGVIAISSIERGLFLVNFTKAFVDPTPEVEETSSPTIEVTSAPTSPSGEGGSGGGGLGLDDQKLALVVLIMAAALALISVVLAAAFLFAMFK